MEKGEYMSDEEEEDDDYTTSKILETLLTFNSHFSRYIKENDKELFKRAIDYAKTFTEEDVDGIVLDYLKEDENGKQ
jgi:hypothetical protein